MPKPKAKKIGRPRFEEGKAKLATLRVRVTPDERTAIEKKSKSSKQTLSEWIRSTLNAAIQG